MDGLWDGWGGAWRVWKCRFSWFDGVGGVILSGWKIEEKIGLEEE